MREIKFRAWDDNTKTMFPNLQDLGHWIMAGKPLMQYTGLKDRTGKEIFEGDIVRYDDYQGVAEVGFRRIEFVEEVEFKGGCFYPVCNQPPYTFEVIGNVWENPNLLK